MKLIKKLISIDADWVPRATPDSPSSLYIRPTSIGTEVSHITWYQYSRTSITVNFICVNFNYFLTN